MTYILFLVIRVGYRRIRILGGLLVMTDATLDDTYVILCDWHGRLVWSSHPEIEKFVGDTVWEIVADESKETIKSCVSRTATLREPQSVRIRSKKGRSVRVWAWPLTSPDNAVCLLCMTVPRELASLAPRELACLRLLGQGIPPKQIAVKLGVSMSTVHTHMQRSREKLRLKTFESLVAFAGHYCRVAVDDNV